MSHEGRKQNHMTTCANQIEYNHVTILTPKRNHRFLTLPLYYL